jgi:hypothetical protein
LSSIPEYENVLIFEPTTKPEDPKILIFRRRTEAARLPRLLAIERMSRSAMVDERHEPFVSSLPQKSQAFAIGPFLGQTVVGIRQLNLSRRERTGYQRYDASALAGLHQ